MESLGRAFALAAEAYVRSKPTIASARAERSARGLSQAFRAIVSLVAIEEARRVDSGARVQSQIRSHAHECALASGWQGISNALSNVGSRMGGFWARSSVSVLMPARRVVYPVGQGASAEEFTSSHDVRTSLTSNVHIPGPDDSGLGTLERSARTAYAAERPLRVIFHAIQRGQLPPLNPARAEELRTLVDRAFALEMISESDRQTLMIAESLTRGYRTVEAISTPDRTRATA